MGKIISMNHANDNLINKVSEYFLTDMKIKDVAPFLSVLDYYYNKDGCDISKEISIRVTDAPDVSKKDIVKFMVKSIKLCDNFNMAAVKNVCVDIFIGILFNETWRTFMSAMDQAYRATHSNKLFYMVLDIAKKATKEVLLPKYKIPTFDEPSKNVWKSLYDKQAMWVLGYYCYANNGIEKQFKEVFSGEWFYDKY